MKSHKKIWESLWLWLSLTVVLIAAVIALVIWRDPGAAPPESTDLPETTAQIRPSASNGETEPGNPVIQPGEQYVPSDGRPVMPTEPEPGVDVPAAQLSFDQFSRYSGQYVEDGRDELVENVAAILVTNTSSRFLEVATVSFLIDGEQATFTVTGLPAGASAWVLEANKRQIGANATFKYVDAATGYRDGAVTSLEGLTLLAEGNNLTAVNATGQTLKSLCVYYKVRHSDGNFLGGITYRVSFGDVEPNTPLTMLAGHYSEDAEIVRISWEK